MPHCHRKTNLHFAIYSLREKEFFDYSKLFNFVVILKLNASGYSLQHFDTFVSTIFVVR